MACVYRIPSYGCRGSGRPVRRVKRGAKYFDGAEAESSCEATASGLAGPGRVLRCRLSVGRRGLRRAGVGAGAGPGVPAGAARRVGAGRRRGRARVPRPAPRRQDGQYHSVLF